jgi:hypothetical protein
MVMAEKIVHRIDGSAMSTSVADVGAHRGATLVPLAEALEGFGDAAQSRWVAWRRKLRLEAITPEQFVDLLDLVMAFADPVIGGTVAGKTWEPSRRTWT